MQNSILISLLVLGTSVSAFATTNEHCPQITSIINPQGIVYKAPANDGGEWLGIAAAGMQGHVKRFNSAIFYPERDADTSRGTLAKCSYELERGIVDLRYTSRTNQELKVALQDISAWQRKEGPFGIIYFECINEAAQSCKFVVP